MYDPEGECNFALKPVFGSRCRKQNGCEAAESGGKRVLLERKIYVAITIGKLFSNLLGNF